MRQPRNPLIHRRFPYFRGHHWSSTGARHAEIRREHGAFWPQEPAIHYVPALNATRTPLRLTESWRRRLQLIERL